MNFMMNLKMTTFNKLFLFFLISANVNSATVKDMNKRIKNIDQEIEQKNTTIFSHFIPPTPEPVGHGVHSITFIILIFQVKV